MPVPTVSAPPASQANSIPGPPATGAEPEATPSRHRGASPAKSVARQGSRDDAAAASRIKEQLATRLGPHKFEMWFGRADLQVRGERVEIATDSPFVAKWIDANFTGDLTGLAREHLGGDAKISVRVTSDDPARRGRTAAAGPGPAHLAHPQSPRGAHQGVASGAPLIPAGRDAEPRRPRGNSLRCLAEFVVGTSNRLAYETARRLIEDPDAGTVSPLFIHGECGLGKTHLLQGICRQFANSSGRPGQVRYVTGEQFTNEYIASLRANNIDAFRNRVRKLDLLAIDDVHFLSNKVRTQGEFLHTLDAIDLSGSRVVLASDEHPRIIKRFSQALISRFLSGMVVQIDRPDRETRVALVARLARARDLELTPAALEAVAGRCVGSVRELEGAVTKLAALRALTPDREGTPDAVVGTVLVERLFQEHGWQPPTPVRIGTVIDVITERLALARGELMGSSRHRRVVLGRALVAYLGREMTTHSYPEIARALGRTYHSTIHTAEQRLRRQMAEELHVQVGETPGLIPLPELVDQLRHHIARTTAAT
ncbi:MAG: AAA family ATPase [Phycisphaerae bacterium]|nr:AAA family ATPase [Phycisphaerae bacterium]